MRKEKQAAISQDLYHVSIDTEPLYNKPLKPYGHLAFMINIGSHSSYLTSTRWAAKPHDKAGIDLRGVHRKLIGLRGVKAMIAAVALRFPPF